MPTGFKYEIDNDGNEAGRAPLLDRVFRLWPCCLVPLRCWPGEVMKEVAALKPGEFSWHPERPRTGPVAVIVSLPEQRVHVYRNGIRIAVSTCSTRKPGQETPTCVFVVLQKDKHHTSSAYDDAPMPNTNWLTWSGQHSMRAICPAIMHPEAVSGCPWSFPSACSTSPSLVCRRSSRVPLRTRRT